jgi:hypothetical protein
MGHATLVSQDLLIVAPHVIRHKSFTMLIVSVLNAPKRRAAKKRPIEFPLLAKGFLQFSTLRMLLPTPDSGPVQGDVPEWNQPPLGALQPQERESFGGAATQGRTRSQ